MHCALDVSVESCRVHLRSLQLELELQVASVTLVVQSGLCRFSHPVRHAPPLGGALAARKARDDRFRLARDGVARHLGFWKPPTHPTRQVTRRRTRRTLPGASEKTRLRKRPHASNPPTVPFPPALRAASAATHWQPRVWSGPRMGPKPGTTHHADVPQRLLSEPLPITDRARVARRDRRGIYDSNSPPGGHDQSGLPVCTGYACVASAST